LRSCSGATVWRAPFACFAPWAFPVSGVALCFATASISFVVALGYTSVANILLMQAGVPLIAALLGVVFLREAVDRVTWAAILAVIAGIRRHGVRFLRRQRVLHRRRAGAGDCRGVSRPPP
jgi:drug/metabolite transporter (DMT)-like permease